MQSEILQWILVNQFLYIYLIIQNAIFSVSKQQNDMESKNL